jgi:integrase
MSKKPFYQQSIRILGKLIRSPKFKTKTELDRWVADKKAEKMLYQEGLMKPADERILLKEYFYKTWLPKRKLAHTKATWGPDEQRFRDYCEKKIGAIRVSKITTPAIKKCLEECTTVHGLSTVTRTRVKALLSKVFSDARNEASPLRSTNPVEGIQFDDGAREGDSTPEYISKPKQVLKYLESARELGSTHLVVASLGIMAGLRKQEMIPLRWKDFDYEEKCLILSRKFVQAENRIMDGTKRGKKVSRIVPVPDSLIKVLTRHKDKSDHQGEEDFILSKPDGSNLGPREISSLTEATRLLAGLEITTHGLRHTYGRFFAVGSGNIKALQTILGHSNSQTTELYSSLGGDAVSSFRNTVSFEVEDE